MAKLVVGFAVAVLIVGLTKAEVPTGCVEIKNIGKNGFLDLGESFTENRIHAVIRQNPGTLWNIVKYDDTYYKINPRKTVKDLFVGSYTYDNMRRYGFVWNSGGVIQGLWDIKEYKPGKFSIRSEYHNEYLYASDHPKGFVFTWYWKKVDLAKESEFLWSIEKC